ncbi:MAG TPA: beta-ketoacyl synthase chain length factor [Burkholderiaceae bacterium]|jgi:hypothetical protein|nr:beta-ketoacyl synthase chain length factor [Burkholderiaceae bacterium]
MTADAVLEVDILGIGLIGPGLVDWPAGRALLRDPRAWQGACTVVPAPARLPANERRRAGAIVRLGIALADQACADAGPDVDAGTLATVFSASSGDGQNCHALCEALATPERVVSPTRFTNSVHNATGGYWHIATASRAASTSLCAYDATFAAGLLEAASQCVAGAQPVLFVSADTPYPEPLNALRPLPDAFGVAFVLAPGGKAAAVQANLRITLGRGDPGRLATPAFEALRRAIPAARSLPLLEALAHGREGRILIDYLDELALCIDIRC